MHMTITIRNKFFPSADKICSHNGFTSIAVKFLTVSTPLRGLLNKESVELLVYLRGGSGIP